MQASEAKASEMEETVASLEVTVEGLKKERNFYYGKLREIEVMCQDVEFGDDMVVLSAHNITIYFNLFISST